MKHLQESLEGSGKGVRLLLSAACFVVVVAGLKLADTIITTFLLSLFLAMLAIPPMRKLQDKGVPAGLAVVIVFLGLMVIFSLVGLLVGESLNQFLLALPTYRSILEQRASEYAGPLRQFLVEQGMIPRDFDLLKSFEFSSVAGPALEVVRTTLSGLAVIFSNVVIVLLTTVFILLEATGFPKKAEVAMLQMGLRKGSLDRFANISREVRDYLVIKTLVSIATGFLLGFWCWSWGVDFAFLWGLLAFLLNYIPNIGSIIAAIPPLGLALVDGGVGIAFGIVTGYVAVNMLVGNVLEPRLMGQRLGLSSLVVLLSLVFWGYVWGGLGMLLSVPLTMIVKILAENSADFRWVSTLLSPAETVPDPER